MITGASPHLFFRGLGPNVVKHEECISQDPGCSKGPCPLTLHFFHGQIVAFCLSRTAHLAEDLETSKRIETPPSPMLPQSNLLEASGDQL